MRKRGFFSELIGTEDNYQLALKNAGRGKKRRPDVVRFSSYLEGNLLALRTSFMDKSYKSSDYNFLSIKDPKERIVGMLPFRDHVQHWAVLNQIEGYFDRSFFPTSFAGRAGRGTHGYFKAIRKALDKYPEKTSVYLLCDIKKFYFSVNHSILKAKVRSRIKDPLVLSFFDEFIDSSGEGIGLYPGTKIAQFLSLVYLYQFDHDCKTLFGIANNPALVDYYSRRYIEERIATARTEKDYIELSRGVEYLSGLFCSYLNRLDFFYRLADDVVILHSDKVFLHFVVEWIGLYYGNELKIELNKKWRVGLTRCGIDTGGYVHYPSHVRVRKRNKQALCRQVARLRKMGIPEDKIQLIISSRAGFVSHSDHTQLFKKLGIMETSERKRLSDKMKAKKVRTPWEDLPVDRKRRFEDILFDSRIPMSKEILELMEREKEIELIDYKVEDSIIEKNSDGTAKKCLVIRYRYQGEEWFSYTGSEVLIDQALNLFGKEDLPAMTVIKIITNKFNKKFYKFT